ncbi:MAG: orotate phosphoribosyltransferase [Endomicrobiaceae bacterium]|nr:orotate phosphoribosyltransferase [Endomicrobiaceae bacterium]
MEQNEMKDLFKKYNALLNGHFLLSSGLHSDTYFQSALILQYPQVASVLAENLKNEITKKVKDIDLIVSPAMGGVIIGQEVGRAFGKRAIFCERVDGKLVLRRGFGIAKGEKVLVVEDVITTGLSTKEVIETITPLGANVVAVCSLVDRSAGKVDFGVPRFSLLSLEVKSYKPEECPLCKDGSSPIKPGSRK